MWFLQLFILAIGITFLSCVFAFALDRSQPLHMRVGGSVFCALAGALAVWYGLPALT